MSIAASDQTTTPAGRLFAVGAVAGLLGGVAALAVALIALALGVSLEVSQPGGGIGQAPLPGFVIATVIQALVGAALALALQRWSSTPARTFTMTAIVLVLLSFAQPLLLAQDTATAITLIVTHIVAAAIVVPALANRLPAGR